MDMLAAAGNGKHYVADDGEELANAMREDLSNPEKVAHKTADFSLSVGPLRINRFSVFTDRDTQSRNRRARAKYKQYIRIQKFFGI